MCKIVIVGKEEAECHTHGDMIDVLGGEPVYLHPDFEIDDDDCLCDVDMKATAEKFCYAITEEYGDMFVIFSEIESGQLERESQD